MPFDPNLGYIPAGQGYAPLEAYNRNFDPATGQQGPTGGVGANPYPYNRYAFQGPQFQGYGSPAQNLYMGYQPEYMTAIDRMAANNRGLALAGGQQLQQDIANFSNYNYGQAGDYTDRLNSAYSGIAEGRGGYTDPQREAILNNNYLQGLQLSPDQMQDNYLSGEEQFGMRGSPYAASDYANQAGENITGLYSNFAGQVGDALGGQERSINDTLRGSGSNMRGAVSDYQGRSAQELSDIASLTRGAVGGASEQVNDALGRSQGRVGGQLDQMGSNLSGALNSEAGAVRSYIDPDQLTTSPEYMANYQVSPQDMQGIKNQAGRAVGAQAAMDEQNLQMAANSAGNVSPLALQAARNRIRAMSAVNAANAMSDAEIKAKQLQLTTQQNRENTRLGAEQGYAGLGTGSELALGGHQIGAATAYGQTGTNAALSLGNQDVNAQMGLGTQNLSNEQFMGRSTLDQRNQTAGAQIGAEQYLAGQNLAGQQYLGNSRLGNTQQLLDSGMQQGQFNAGLGTSALQGAEAQAAGRAGALATNRQGINQANQGQQFGRGQYIYDAGSQANLGFANNQQQQEAEYRNYLSGAQNQANQNATVGNQQRLGAYSATNQGLQGATTNAIQNYAIPGAWQALANTVGNFLPSTSITKGFATGGIEDGPQLAEVGEAGPELIIDLPKRRNNPFFDDLLRRTQTGNAEEKPVKEGKSPFLPLARGGGARPKAELVNGSQVRMLGAKGPQAVVPLTRRKGNRLNVEDIPKLMGGR